MKKIILFTFLFATAATLKSQNLITNPDFEIYSACPVGLDEVYKANNWVSIIQSPDYYNCSFLQFSAFQQAVVGAYSGTGFMGFASYGLANGAAEAIAQTLQQPLLPGNNYTITLAAKKTNTGSYSSVCGGVAVYGIKGLLPSATSGVHVSTLPGCSLLGVSPTISNDLWQTFTFNLTVADTVDNIVFTVELGPACTECIFLDSTALYITPDAVEEHGNETSFNIYPNPVKENIIISSELGVKEKTEIIVRDVLGKEVYHYQFSNSKFEIPTYSFQSGIYFIEINNGKEVYRKKFLKE